MQSSKSFFSRSPSGANTTVWSPTRIGLAYQGNVGSTFLRCLFSDKALTAIKWHQKEWVVFSHRSSFLQSWTFVIIWSRSIPSMASEQSESREETLGFLSAWGEVMFQQQLEKTMKKSTKYTRSIHFSFRNMGSVQYLGEGHWYAHYQNKNSKKHQSDIFFFFFQMQGIIFIENHRHVSRLNIRWLLS